MMNRPGKFHVQIDTPRCLLRRLIAEDVEWLTDLNVDPEVNRFIDDEVSSRDEAKYFAAVTIDSNSSCEFGYWAIQDKETGVIHGWTALGKLRPRWGSRDEFAVSYVLRRASWGKGLATEAAGKLVRRALEDQWLDRIMGVIAVGNTASKRVLEKIGMHAVENPNPLGPKEFEYFLIDAP